MNYRSKIVPNDLVVVIMAGGMGKRMESNIPKVLHLYKSKPMLVHIIEQAYMLNPQKIVVVVGKFQAEIETELKNYISKHIISHFITFVPQLNPQGTGHAIQCCKQELTKYMDCDSLILCGDTPLIRAQTLQSMIDHKKADIQLMTCHMPNPTGYGRIIKSPENDEFLKIVEEKDCNAMEVIVNNINCGIYVMNTNVLCTHLDKLKNNNAQKEYYLTDIPQIALEHGATVETYDIVNDITQIIGVNTKQQLDFINQL